MPRKKGSKNKKKLAKIIGTADPLAHLDDVVTLVPTTFTLLEKYKLTVKSVGRIFTSEGSTLEEALRKIKITGGAKAMAVLKVEKGEQVKERILNAGYSQKLFTDVGPTMKDFAIRKVIELIGL